MRCHIVKDLLSNYINGLTSEETNKEIRSHLDNCADCCSFYEKMAAVCTCERSPDHKNIGFFKKVQVKMLQKSMIAAVLICMILLSGVFILAKNYYIPIPFDQNYMSVETYKAALIVNKNGYVSLRNLDRLKDMIPEDQDHVIDAVQLVYQGINNISSDLIYRTVSRSGKDVKVYYYCYQESLWDSLLADPALRRGGEFRHINSKGYDSLDYEPQMTEIYYLPIKHLSKFENLSDEEFDRLREKGRLIWSGIS